MKNETFREIMSLLEEYAEDRKQMVLDLKEINEKVGKIEDQILLCSDLLSDLT